MLIIVLKVAPHAFCSKMLAERTASRNGFVLFYFIY